MKALAPFSMVLLAIAIFNTACSMETVSSKDVKPEAVNQSYSVTYDQDRDSTSMWAQFRVGGSTGTTVDLDDPASLTINGKTPSKSTLFGTAYETSLSGFVSDASFVYNTGAGQTLTNSISLRAMSLVSAPQNLTPSAGYAVLVQVPGYSSDDNVSASLTETLDDGQGHTQFFSAIGYYDSGRSQIVFNPTELAALKPGTATLKISRSHDTNVSQSTGEGGYISATYNLRSIAVSVGGSVAPLAGN
jgi:hypothetical protein